MKVNSYQKTIKEFFEGSMILIQENYDYNYSQKECQKLWDELLNFNLPNGNHKAFNTDDEHLIGAMVTSATDSGQTEIIGDPQKLLMIFLLIEVFYEKCYKIQSEKVELILQTLEKCIWKTDEFGNVDMKTSRIEINSDSHIARNNFYKQNREFFKMNVDELAKNDPTGFLYFMARFLNNCTMFQIESKSKDSAQQILNAITCLK